MKREIIAKTLMGKGKLLINANKEIDLLENVSKTLGCWIINHKFTVDIKGKVVSLIGSYDIQLWYALDNDSKTNVYYETIVFEDVFTMSYRNIVNVNDDIVAKVHVIKYPTACKMELKDEKTVLVEVESEYFVDVFQDAILKIETLEEENDYEIIDEEIVMNVNPNYIQDKK